MCNAKTLFGYLYNLVLWFSGATLVGVGAYVTIDVFSYIDLIGKQWISVALAYIGVGGLVILGSFIGGFSASSNNRVWINIYMVLLWTTLLVEISGAVLTIIFEGDIADRVEQQLNSTILSYNDGNDELVKEWDAMQKTVECCGASSYTQWFPLRTYVPISCCTGGDHCSVRNDTTYQTYIIYTDDCNHKVSQLLELYALIIWSSGFCVAFVTMLGIVFSFWLRFPRGINCCTTKEVDLSVTSA